MDGWMGEEISNYDKNQGEKTTTSPNSNYYYIRLLLHIRLILGIDLFDFLKRLFKKIK